MVAVPSPISVLPVTMGGRKIDALIPPTYVRYNATFKEVLDDMKANALGADAEAEILRAPLKSLAVHMGLVSYGRNNITYVPGLGSGYQLCGYIVWPRERAVEVCPTAEGRETALERCTSCRACIKACPTGAIREDRFLISAERCFTLHSESRRPIPAWARPPKSLCLIGCMNCQQVCPENKGRLKTVPSGVEFTAEETEAVINAGRRLATSGSDAGHAAKSEESPSFISARAKFEKLGMSEDLEVMGRNLDYFLRIIPRRRSSRRP
jgi:epoxyqueuosine reductase